MAWTGKARRYAGAWYRLLRDLLLRTILWIAGKPERAPTAKRPAADHPLLYKSATELAAMIRERKVKSRAVVEAYIARAREVNPHLNAIVRDRFDEALREADAADAKIQRGEDVGRYPFHGVPCTIKECFALTGMPNTSGLVSRQRRVGLATADAAAVQRLRASGFIPLGVTNVSELCMWYESNNKVYGRTNNPYNLQRIVGGSSGGEGSIIGAGASPCGLGSDIGGSIRMPAFFNGVFGHKPSPAVVPNDGQVPLAQGEAARYCTTGPICRDACTRVFRSSRYAADLWPMLQVMANANIELGDPLKVDLAKLRVYSLTGLRGSPIVQSPWRYANQAVDPELRAAQARALEHLTRSRGVRLETLPADLEAEFADSFSIWSAMVASAKQPSFSRPCTSDHMGDGRKFRTGTEILRLLSGRSPHTIPAVVLAAVEHLPQTFSPAAERALVQRGLALRKRMQQLLRDDGILLFPPHPTTAPLHNAPLFTPFNFCFTAIVNVLELPATSVPLGLDRQGLPTGVQVIANQGRDATCIAVALELEKAFGGWVRPSAV